MEGINQKDWMCRKHKEVYKVLNYIEYLLILVFATTGYALIFSFASLVPTMSSAKGLKICLITAGVKSISQWVKKGESMTRYHHCRKIN